ncbi:signal recognition particle srp9 subunit [Pyrenophora tritici-repentis]|uniref:SRP9-21 domain containing protein n=1 Tax=Pyrenophora tritici-repentis TaxID=45151 RepID=A0A2W1EL06_9PLEO|nr:signal recognition particle srp9 subunit [Pyrenophora tritici-repentis]KAF7449311.1 signal recognition particle srp9 protein [Pyrenophora tritici-repentis]KAF7570673.1 SRP9-21 domain containing protein [Pyrenophora tritici-repentis]KAG9383743.1 signal recognition particle srp9 protein [Pyrenophora tritici-repentis]KAI0585236.1 signal recognition particle srp9 subunit [Pyrenophora tritici-repentis]
MPYFTTSAEWLEQSSLLLKARPTSTRITSKYTVLKPTPSKIAKRKAYEAKRASRPADTTRTSSPPPQSQDVEEVTVTFTLKTYDPASGTSLKYETTKGAEVGRLIGNLGRLGRHMAALPELAEESAAGEGASAPQADESGDVKMGGVPADPKAGTGTGGKKKKKGKK